MNTIGRYQLLEKLGQGGMGVVHRAVDPLLQRTVAVKLISGAIDSNDELRERFFREARAAGQLSHKNIITIFDLGEHEGQPFLAMEFLEGQDLQQRLATPPPMTLARKLDLAIEVCEGIEYAHVHGVVHRDIKPANIFITNTGTVKLLDFGLARMITSELTHSNMMMGTLNYMAPEQVRGERADHRSDIFSTGVVLYEVLAGRKAFEGDSFGATLYKILEEVPEPLPNLDASIPLPLVAIVDQAMKKGREERYQHMSEMLGQLLEYRQLVGLANSPAQGRPASVGGLPPSIGSDAPTMAHVRPIATLPSGSGTPISGSPESGPRGYTPTPTAGSRPGSAPSAGRPGSSPSSSPSSATESTSPGTPPPSAPSSATRPATDGTGNSRRPVAMAVGLGVLVVAGFAIWSSMSQPAPSAPAVDRAAQPPAAAAPQPVPAAPTTAAASDAQQRTEKIEQGLASARSLLASGRYDDASRAAAEVLGLDPGNIEAKRVMDEGAAGSRGKGAEEARKRMSRAKTAAMAASAHTFATAPYNAALAAEREASSFYKEGRAADAMAKFWEAAGLFSSAEIAARAEAAARTERARVAAAERKATEAPAQEPAPAPKPPQAPAPPISPIPTTTGVPLPSVPPPDLPPAATKPAPTQGAATDTPLPPSSPTAGIPDLLEKYKAALESRSLDSLKRLWPGLGGAQESAIRGEFQNASRIEVEIINPQTTIRGNNATVTFLRRYQLQTVDRQRLRTETRTTMRLQRSGNVWLIEQMTFEPVR